MRRLKDILVGLDGSMSAHHALKESIRMAQWAQGRVTVITVAPSYEGDLSLVGVRNLKAAMDGSSAEALARALEAAEAAGTEIGVICEEGEAHERIAERAGRGGFDLVALGQARGRTLRHTLFGTLCARLAPLLQTDILVIPHLAEISWERSFYLDWLPEAGPETLARAAGVCAAHGSELHSARIASHRGGQAEISFFEPLTPASLAVLPQPSGNLAQVRRQAMRHSARFRHLPKQIGSHLRDTRVGMFLLPYQGSSGMGGWLTRRLFESMVAESPCPIMILTGNR